MKFNETFDSINEALPRMLNIIHNAGSVIPSRVGETTEITHVGISLHEPCRREILLPSRKPNIAAQIVETMWVLAGKNDVETLAHYLPRAADFSDDGKTWRAGYGQRLRSWQDHLWDDPQDQIAWVVEHLKNDPGSRRAVLSIWDPVMDTEDGVKDIPCNDWLSFLIRDGHLDLHVAVRSNDVIWGWSGINQFEWSVLLEIVAGLVGVKVGSLHFSTTSLHLYDRHYAKAEKIVENAYPLPPQNLHVIRFDPSQVTDVMGLDSTIQRWFEIEERIRTKPHDPADWQAAVNIFPEPLMRAWLRVLQWWWTGEREYLSVLEGSTLERGTTFSVQPKRDLPVLTVDEFAEFRLAPGALFGVPHATGSDFMVELCSLHLEKDAAYGDSWKKRGELFSILPNIGRKIDRLGTGGTTADETTADTAEDLLVYLAKYTTWLNDHYSIDGPSNSDRAEDANHVMRDVERKTTWSSAVTDTDVLKETLVAQFEELLELAEAKSPRRRELVNEMLPTAYLLARTLWSRETLSGSLDEYRGADRD